MDCLREHCLLHHPGQAAGDAPLGEWGPREQAEWNQRVRGIDMYMESYGEHGGPDSDLIAEGHLTVEQLLLCNRFRALSPLRVFRGLPRHSFFHR